MLTRRRWLTLVAGSNKHRRGTQGQPQSRENEDKCSIKLSSNGSVLLDKVGKKPVTRFSLLRKNVISDADSLEL